MLLYKQLSMASYYKRVRKFYKKNIRKPYRKFAKSNPELAAAMITGLKGASLLLLKNKLGLNTETKFLDTVMASTALTTGTWTALTTPIIIPQGITTNTRVGNNVRLRSLDQRLTIRSGSSSNCVRVRVLGFIQKRMLEAGQVFLPIDVLQDSTSQFNSPYNMDTNGYTIIYDRTFEISADPEQGSTKQINMSYRPLNHQIEWTNSDTTGVASNLLRGYIKYHITTDAPATMEPTFEAYTRVKYVDN